MNIQTERVNGPRIRHGCTEAGASAKDELLPAPSSRLPSSDSSMVLQTILRRMSETSIGVAEGRIARNEKLVENAIEEAHAARMREAEARREDGGLFEGLGTAIEALTVDLAKLENLSDPLGALERALEKAGDATIHSRQFWVDLEKGALEVAKWAAVAGSVTLAVLSCGAAAPVAALAIVGAVMSSAAAADSTFHILEQCGVDKETAMWIDVGLAVGGALCSGGAGVAQALQGGANTASAALRASATAADGLAGAGTAVGGAAHVQVAGYEREAKLAEADAVDAERAQGRIERRIQQVLEFIRDTLASCERGLQRVDSSMNQHNATMVAIMRA